MTAAVLDNDIVIKAAMYSLLSEVADTLAPSISQCGVLGALRFVAAEALRRRNREDLIESTLALIDAAEALEPSTAERNAAAEIELAAQRGGVQLDAGESLLFAIAEARKIRPLATGDKRAIVALESVLSEQSKAWWHLGVVCFEQVVSRLIEVHGAPTVRKQICASPKVDVALTLCFACKSGTTTPSEWQEGLTSYIEHLRKQAPTLLAKS